MNRDPNRTVSRRHVLRITAVAGTAVALGGGLTAAFLRRAGLHRVRATRTRMGTLVTLTVVHPAASAARRMIELGFAELERLEAVLSRHRPETPLSRLNREGVLADPPAELVHVVVRGLEHSSRTAGAFDVTVAPLLELYARAFASTGGPPTNRQVDDALAAVGYQSIRVDERRIAFERPGMAVTLDGIAKGYIVDRTLAALREAGAERVLVDAGGDMASTPHGAADTSWRVAIRDPRDGDRALDILRLGGESVATSGDYMQPFSRDLRHHHILDPRTGRSPDHTSGATVVAPTAMDADALATAAMVLGPVEGLALLERLDRVEGAIVSKSGEQVRTEGLGGHVV